MKRFIRIFNKLPEQLRNHIVLENDDKSYNINDVMKIHKYCGMPIVLDYHHHVCCNNGSELDLKAIFDTWGGNRIPKIHMSSPKSDKEFRSHSEYIDINYCKDFLKQAEAYTYDLMIESKKKDLAVEKFKIDYLNIK
jgi:UV DNA damage endonuclease